MKEVYNLNNLIKIEIFDKTESKRYYYINKLKIGRKIILKEGIIDTQSFFLKYVNIDDISENHLIVGNNVYIKPRCILYFNNMSKTVYSNKYSEIVDYVTSLRNNFNSTTF